MSNLEKYNKVFVDTFNVDEAALSELRYQGIEAWDSVGHMELIAELEDIFDIMFHTEDIERFSSYDDGKAILREYNVEF